MNYIKILEPRWSTEDVLIAENKIGNVNQIKIDWHVFPDPFYMTGEELRSYPTHEIWSEKYNQYYTMRVVPLHKLNTDLILDTL